MSEYKSTSFHDIVRILPLSFSLSPSLCLELGSIFLCFLYSPNYVGRKLDLNQISGFSPKMKQNNKIQY